MHLAARLADLLQTARTEPAAAARELRAAAAKLVAAAEQLERRAAEQTRSTGGGSDRVRLAVVGPDGAVRQTTDTGAVS